MKQAILLVIFMTALGCEQQASQKSSESSAAPTPAARVPAEGKFFVEMKVSGSQDVYRLEAAPKPDQVQKMLQNAINAGKAFEEGGSRKLKGAVTYDVQALPNDGGWDVVLLGGLTSPQANFKAGVNLQGTDEKWKGRTISEMVDDAVKIFAERIDAQARVLGGDNPMLLEIMNDPDEPESARLMAIQEVRERRASEHLDAVRKFLAAEHPVKIRLAAAATLVSLGDEKSRSDIIKVAEDFSRERNPQYVPLLHILGDLGGQEVLTYLETVAEAHPAPAVRSVAQEALTKARQGLVKK